MEHTLYKVSTITIPIISPSCLVAMGATASWCHPLWVTRKAAPRLLGRRGSQPVIVSNLR